MNVIVVGIDGSAHSVAALRHAIHEARAHDAMVRAVHAWHLPTIAYGAPVAPATFMTDLEEEARETLEQALAAAADIAEGVRVQLVVREGEAGHVLVAESEGAYQLVVGSRGRGSIGELLLGSVSHHCCRHAHCPVTVIPHACEQPPA